MEIIRVEMKVLCLAYLKGRMIDHSIHFYCCHKCNNKQKLWSQFGHVYPAKNVHSGGQTPPL